MLIEVSSFCRLPVQPVAPVDVQVAVEHVLQVCK